MTTHAPAPARPKRRPPQVPRTADISDIDLDILSDLLSFYIRVINQVLGRDLDHQIRGTPVARGTGKISTLLLVAANPGIRPSVIAHFNMKDRSAMVRILDQLRRAGLLRQSVSATERRGDRRADAAASAGDHGHPPIAGSGHGAGLRRRVRVAARCRQSPSDRPCRGWRAACAARPR